MMSAPLSMNPGSATATGDNKSLSVHRLLPATLEFAAVCTLLGNNSLFIDLEGSVVISVIDACVLPKPPT